MRLVRDILYELLDTGIISETVTKSIKENAYQPAQDIDKLSIGFVFERLEKRGKDSITTDESKDLAAMTKVVDQISNEIQNSKNNKLVHEIV